jgi:hypothetical protein
MAKKHEVVGDECISVEGEQYGEIKHQPVQLPYGMSQAG